MSSIRVTSLFEANDGVLWIGHENGAVIILTNGIFQPFPVTAEVRHNLFLAFKEALHNIVNHAAATEVNVALRLEENKLIVTVVDNGGGFNANNPRAALHAKPDHIEQGNGLKNMNRRLAEIGGACEVQSVPGQGTTVKFTMPLRA